MNNNFIQKYKPLNIYNRTYQILLNNIVRKLKGQKVKNIKVIGSYISPKTEYEWARAKVTAIVNDIKTSVNVSAEYICLTPKEMSEFAKEIKELLTKDIEANKK